MERTIFESEHRALRDAWGDFLDREVAPVYDQWERERRIPRKTLQRIGQLGFLAPAAPGRFGGPGADDFRFNAVLTEEAARRGFTGVAMALSVHHDVAVPYLLELTSEEQKERWLPVVTAVRTGDSGRHDDISILVLESGMPGFERGRNLEKLGTHSQDTAELFFEDVEVPAENLLGEEGQGFRYLMRNLAQERLAIAVTAAAGARGALERTLEYVKVRKAFGRPVGTFQNSRFKLAACHAEMEVTQAHIDAAILAHVEGRLSPEDASIAKWWATESQGRIVDACLQLHDGYGYMLEYPISRAYVDARVNRIYGGSNEIMLEIVGRSLGLGEPRG